MCVSLLPRIINTWKYNQAYNTPHTVGREGELWGGCCVLKVWSTRMLNTCRAVRKYLRCIKYRTCYYWSCYNEIHLRTENDNDSIDKIVLSECKRAVGYCSFGISLHWRNNGYSDADQRNIKAPRHWPLCGNSPGPGNSPHRGPVTRKMFPFDDVIMYGFRCLCLCCFQSNYVMFTALYFIKTYIFNPCS